MVEGGLSSWYTDTSNSDSPISVRANRANSSQDIQDLVHKCPSPSNNSAGANHYQSPLISPGDWNVVSPSPPYITYTTTNSSPQSNDVSSFQERCTNSPMSVVETAEDIRSALPSTPPSSFEHEPPVLPTTLGGSNYQQGRNGNSNSKINYNNRYIQYSTTNNNKQFLEKSKMEQEREKIANRRVQSMMTEGCRNAARSRQKADDKIERQKSAHHHHQPAHHHHQHSSFGKREAKLHLLPSGMEYLASSSRMTKEKTQPIIMEDLEGSVNDFKNGFDKDRERAAQKHAMRMITRLNNAA